MQAYTALVSLRIPVRSNIHGRSRQPFLASLSPVLTRPVKRHYFGLVVFSSFIVDVTLLKYLLSSDYIQHPVTFMNLHF